MIFPTEEQLARLADIAGQAFDAGDTDALARVADLLAWALQQTTAPAGASHTGADPTTRAHAREDWPGSERETDGLRKLRKGRRQCSATRRDGTRCRAPAIAGGDCCLKHGGSAPQVQIAAKHALLLTARYTAHRAWEDAQGDAPRVRRPVQGARRRARTRRVRGEDGPARRTARRTQTKANDRRPPP